MKFVAALALVASMTFASETEHHGPPHGGYDLGRGGYGSVGLGRGGYGRVDHGRVSHGRVGRGRGGYGDPYDSRRVGRSHGRRDLGRQYGRSGYGSRSYRPKPVYQPPKTTYAKCMLKDPEEENYLGGTISLRQDGYGSVWITGDVWGVEPGKHDFHVHEYGDLRQGCKSLEGHWNGVAGASYTDGPGKSYIGDLKSVIANKSGDARVDQKDSAITLTGPETIIGRSLVLHGVVKQRGYGHDSYGSSGSGYAVPSGPRIACCTIGLTSAPKRAGYGYG